MVTIELYRNYSEPLKVNKDLEWVTTLTGTFRSGTSITNPIIEIESSEYIDIDFDVVTSDNNEVVTSSGDELSIITDSNRIVNINYIYIKEFNRYYYVTDVVCLLNKLYQFICDEDELYTLKDKYLNKEALVERNEFTYYDGIEDNKMPYEFYQDVTKTIVTDSSEINFDTQTTFGDHYVIGFVNDVDRASYEGIITSPISCLPDIKSDAIGLNKFAKCGVISASDLSDLASQTYDEENQLSFITSIVAFPFDVPKSTDFDKLRLGSTDYQYIYVYYNQAKMLISPYFKVASIDFRNYFTGSYMDYEPYTKYELYLPFYNYVELKSADIRNSVVNVYYSFDYTNGMGKINIVNITKNYVISSYEFTCGVKLAINRNNLQQLEDERTQMSIKGAISNFASALSIIGGAIAIGTGVGSFIGAGMIASGVTSIATNMTEIGAKLSMQHERATTSNNTGYGGAYGSRDVILKITRTIKREPDNYTHYYGKPLNANVKLSDLSGYTLIKDIYLDDIGATKSEIDALYSLLTNGIIL